MCVRIPVQDSSAATAEGEESTHDAASASNIDAVVCTFEHTINTRSLISTCVFGCCLAARNYHLQGWRAADATCPPLHLPRCQGGQSSQVDALSQTARAAR